MLNYLYLLHQYFVEGKIGQQCTCTTNCKKNQYNWDCNLKTQSHFKKRRTAVGFWGNKRIIWATVGSSAAVFLADIDLFIGRTTNFVFVGSRYNIFCVGGRQSLNNPSNVPQSSSVLRQTVCYVCCWSVDIQENSKFLLNVDRPSTNITNWLNVMLSVNWNNAHVVTGEYLAILELFILSADRKNQTLALRITYCSFLKRTQS